MDAFPHTRGTPVFGNASPYSGGYTPNWGILTGECTFPNANPPLGSVHYPKALPNEKCNSPVGNPQWGGSVHFRAGTPHWCGWRCTPKMEGIPRYGLYTRIMRKYPHNGRYAPIRGISRYWAVNPHTGGVPPYWGCTPPDLCTQCFARLAPPRSVYGNAAPGLPPPRSVYANRVLRLSTPPDNTNNSVRRLPTFQNQHFPTHFGVPPFHTRFTRETVYGGEPHTHFTRQTVYEGDEKGDVRTSRDKLCMRRKTQPYALSRRNSV